MGDHVCVLWPGLASSASPLGSVPSYLWLTALLLSRPSSPSDASLSLSLSPTGVSLRVGRHVTELASRLLLKL